MLEIPVSVLFEGALESSPHESSLPQDIVDFMESEEGARFAAAFSRITDRKIRRGIARLTSGIAAGRQPNASAKLLQRKEPVDQPADNT